MEETELVELAMIGCRIGKKTSGYSTPEAFHPTRTAPPSCGSTFLAGEPTGPLDQAMTVLR